MPKVKNIEKKIWDIEGFDVRILHPDGRDVRDDFSGLLQKYRYEKCGENGMTVESWKTSRFKSIYPGFDVTVLDGDGNECHGNMLLANVKDSYSDE